MSGAGGIGTLRVDGAWLPEHTQRWRDEGRPAVSYRPTGGRLDFLQELDGLRELFVVGTVDDDSAVEACVDLRRLVLHTVPPPGVERLDLTALKELDFLDVDDRILPESLTQLAVPTMIYMHWPYVDLEPLSGNRALRRLRLNSARRLKVLTASTPPLLEVLAVGRTGATLSLVGIEAYADTLRSVILEELRVEAYEYLAGLPALKGLHIDSTSDVASLDFVRSLSNLKWFVWEGSGRILSGDLCPLDQVEHADVRPRRGYNRRRELPLVDVEDLTDDPDDYFWI